MGLISSFLKCDWLNWRQLSLVCIAAKLIFLVTVQKVPEEPNYFVNIGRVEEALDFLERLRGDMMDVSLLSFY